jgi:hypothetical protein
VCPDPPQGLRPQLAPTGSQRETQAQGVIISWHAEVVVFVVIPLIDVETLATWVITLVVKAVAIVRVAGEAVVTCGHEVSHGTGVGVVLRCAEGLTRRSSFG